MTTSVTFPEPKDPASSAWYWINFGVPLASVRSVVPSVSTLAGTAPSGTAQWTTPGDALAGSPLAASLQAVGNDGVSAMFWLTGGVPGVTYAVRADVVDTAGNELFESAILAVTGL